MNASLIFRPYHPSAADTVYRDRLPHRSREGRTIFVTWRLSDSLPPLAELEAGIRRAQQRWLLREKLNLSPLTQNVEHILQQRDPAKALEYRLLSFRVREQFAEKKLGSCALQSPKAVATLRSAILEERKWNCGIGDFVICFNHVHLLMIPGGKGALRPHLQRIKGRASYYLGRAGVVGLPKPVWQRSWFDHAVRNRGKLERIRGYMADHPLSCPKAHYVVEWA